MQRKNASAPTGTPIPKALPNHGNPSVGSIRGPTFLIHAGPSNRGAPPANPPRLLPPLAAVIAMDRFYHGPSLGFSLACFALLGPAGRGCWPQTGAREPWSWGSVLLAVSGFSKGRAFSVFVRHGLGLWRSGVITHRGEEAIGPVRADGPVQVLWGDGHDFTTKSGRPCERADVLSSRPVLAGR